MKMRAGLIRLVVAAVLAVASPCALAAQAGDGPRAWAVDPATPGDDRPPVGRSLFDALVTEVVDGAPAYRVPYPFAALTDAIARHAPVRQLLVPMGRALQRHAAAPDFFRHPRIVLAVDSEGGSTGTRFKDRLYLGYQEKTESIEVISYNAAAGRFEFQIVEDYAAGKTPRVVYANRTLCIGCHQNQGPIFSEPLWDETNANPGVAERLAEVRADFHGVPVAPGPRAMETALAVNRATDRANLFAAYQLLWRESCGDGPPGIRCRAALFAFALQYRMSGARHYDAGSPRFADELAPWLLAQWRTRWPAGLAIPDPGIPNRDPIAFGDRVPAELDPLTPRPPLEVWPLSETSDIGRLIAGLAEFLAPADVARLDEFLFEQGRNMNGPRRNLSASCAMTGYDLAGWAYRVRFQCGGSEPDEFSVDGQFYIKEGEPLRGKVNRLWIEGAETFDEIDLAGGGIAQHDGQFTAALRLRQSFGGRHPRRADGAALESLTLSWRALGEELTDPSAETSRQADTGDASLAVIDDFAPVHDAIAAMANDSAAGRLDVFAAKPFRRADLMRALFAELAIAPFASCCEADGGLPPIALPRDRATTESGSGVLSTFFRYCARCHGSADRFPPNFLHGDAQRVSANLTHCAPRLYYRLRMWRAQPGNRAKTPMPPVGFLQELNISAMRWRDGPELASLDRNVEAMLGIEAESVVSGDYEDLRGCLPDAE